VVNVFITVLAASRLACSCCVSGNESQDYVSRCAFVMLLLVLNNLCSMESEGIVIRIKTPVGDMDSIVDYPSHLNFNDLLVSCCFTCI